MPPRQRQIRRQRRPPPRLGLLEIRIHSFRKWRQRRLPTHRPTRLRREQKNRQTTPCDEQQDASSATASAARCDGGGKSADARRCRGKHPGRHPGTGNVIAAGDRERRRPDARPAGPNSHKRRHLLPPPRPAQASDPAQTPAAGQGAGTARCTGDEPKPLTGRRGKAGVLDRQQCGSERELLCAAAAGNRRHAAARRCCNVPRFRRSPRCCRERHAIHVRLEHAARRKVGRHEPAELRPSRSQRSDAAGAAGSGVIAAAAVSVAGLPVAIAARAHGRLQSIRYQARSAGARPHRRTPRRRLRAAR